MGREEHKMRIIIILDKHDKGGMKAILNYPIAIPVTLVRIVIFHLKHRK